MTQQEAGLQRSPSSAWPSEPTPEPNLAVHGCSSSRTRCPSMRRSTRKPSSGQTGQTRIITPPSARRNRCGGFWRKHLHTAPRMRDRCAASEDARHLQTGRTARSDGRARTESLQQPVHALFSAAGTRLCTKDGRMRDGWMRCRGWLELSYLSGSVDGSGSGSGSCAAAAD